MTQPATFDERARTLTQSLLTEAERIPSRLPRHSANTRPWKAIALFAGSVLVIGGAIVGASVALHSGTAAKPPPASHASHWKSFQLPGNSVGSAVSCPDANECVALGSGGDVYFSSNPAGGTDAWKIASVEPTRADPQGKDLNGISCAGRSLCAAVDNFGNIVTSTNPGGGAAAWTLTYISGVGDLNAISCPEVNLCVAIGGTSAKVDPVGLVITSTDPSRGPRAWSVSKLEGVQDLRSISCVGATFCIAMDGVGKAATSTDPTGGPQAWHVTDAGATFGVVAVDCPTVGLCVGVQNMGAVVTSTDPSGPGPWTRVVPDASLIFMSVSCPSTTFCIAGPQWDSVLVSNEPTGGPSAWTRQRVIASGAEPMWGLSCPSTRFCVGVGDLGVHIYMNPNG